MLANGRQKKHICGHLCFGVAKQAVFAIYGCVCCMVGSFQITENLKLKSK